MLQLQISELYAMLIPAETYTIRNRPVGRPFFVRLAFTVDELCTPTKCNQQYPNSNKVPCPTMKKNPTQFKNKTYEVEYESLLNEISCTCVGP